MTSSRSTVPGENSDYRRTPYVSYGMRVATAWSWRLLVVFGVLAVAVWLLSKVTVVLIPLMVSLLLSALLSPLVSFLIRHKWPRLAAASTVFVGFIGLILGLILLVGQQLIAGFTELVDQVVLGFKSISYWLQHRPLGLDSSVVSNMIDEGINEALITLKSNSKIILGGALGAASSVGTFLTGIVLTLFATFFFLYDGRMIFRWLLRLLPRPARKRSRGAAVRGWMSLVQYVRVQIIVAAVDALGIGLGAFFIGLPLVVPLTVLVFLGSFVPIVGAVVTGAVAVVVALVSEGVMAAIIMLGVVLAIQQLEGNVLQPFIMGKAVSVHPLAVVLAVTAGAFIYGIAGALFAVPLIAAVNTMILYIQGHDVLDPHREEKRARRHVT